MKMLPGLELGQSDVFSKLSSVYMEEKKQIPGMHFKEWHPFKLKGHPKKWNYRVTGSPLMQWLQRLCNPDVFGNECTHRLWNMGECCPEVSYQHTYTSPNLRCWSQREVKCKMQLYELISVMSPRKPHAKDRKQVHGAVKSGGCG